LATILGLATNILGPTDKIHVVRNPVFFLVTWNLMIYVALLVLIVLKHRVRFRSEPSLDLKPAAQSNPDEKIFPYSHEKKVPWAARHLLPGLWQFVHKIIFGFQNAKALTAVTSRFSMHWFSVAGPIVVARWRYLLHLGALYLALGAIVGMYFRGLFQGYKFVWASTFVTNESTVSSLVNILFGPSLFISRLLNFRLSERIDTARLLTPEGDTSDAWIHLFAIMVALTIIVPRALLALSQVKNITTLVNSFGVALDKYYGEVIEPPIRSLIEKEAQTAISEFSAKVAAYVGLTLYDERITPKLREFREKGGRISDLKSELIRLTETFSPELKAYILDTAIPDFQRSLSQRVGEILKSIGTDFIDKRDPEAILHDLKIHAPGTEDLGVSDQFGKAIGAAVGTAITLTFATIGGGIGEELGIAVIATILGTTGPIGFVIGLIIGGLVAAGAWWFGKERITEAVDRVKLPAVIVRTALWESRFKQLVEDGRKKCEESVRTKVKERLTPMLPKITDEIIFRVRSLWGA
jgi:Protein of unknown function (DUF2868)